MLSFLSRSRSTLLDLVSAFEMLDPSGAGTSTMLHTISVRGFQKLLSPFHIAKFY